MDDFSGSGDDDDGSLSGGAIAGIVVGIFFGAIGLTLSIIALCLEIIACMGKKKWMIIYHWGWCHENSDPHWKVFTFAVKFM